MRQLEWWMRQGTRRRRNLTSDMPDLLVFCKSSSFLGVADDELVRRTTVTSVLKRDRVAEAGATHLKNLRIESVLGQTSSNDVDEEVGGPSYLLGALENEGVS